MTEIVWRVPSRGTQYGYVEVKYLIPDEGPPSPEGLAHLYTQYVYAFQKAETDTLETIAQGLRVDPRDAIADPHAAAVAEIKEQLGATDLGEGEETDSPPWEQKLAPKRKPWEAGGTAPESAAIPADVERRVADIEW